MNSVTGRFLFWWMLLLPSGVFPQQFFLQGLQPGMHAADPPGSSDAGGWYAASMLFYGVHGWSLTEAGYRYALHQGITGLEAGYEGIPGYADWHLGLSHLRKMPPFTVHARLRYHLLSAAGSRALHRVSSDLSASFQASETFSLQSYLFNWPGIVNPRIKYLAGYQLFVFQALWYPGHKLAWQGGAALGWYAPLSLSTGLTWFSDNNLSFSIHARLPVLAMGFGVCWLSHRVAIRVRLQYDGLPGTSPGIILLQQKY